MTELVVNYKQIDGAYGCKRANQIAVEGYDAFVNIYGAPSKECVLMRKFEWGVTQIVEYDISLSETNTEKSS